MRRTRAPTHKASGKPRPSRRIAEAARDHGGSKPGEATSCPRCRASYRDGRWTWETSETSPAQKVCPACERIEQNYPAGVLHATGAFARAHREDLVGLARNIEERERAEHPLKRIMKMEDDAEGLIVETTDAKLVESIGTALYKAYKGKLTLPHTTAEKGNLVRVHWKRD
jgi:NMD protein affecting ribosome stability and mRNA decay